MFLNSTEFLELYRI